MSIPQQGVPQAPIADAKTGNATPVWYSFFLNLWNRTGGALGTLSPMLDTIADVPGSLLYRAASQWLGLNPGQQYQVMRMGADFPEWDALDGNSFGAQPKGEFFASPPNGAGAPSFRALAGVDLSPIQGQYPAALAAAIAGNLGEYVFSQIAAGAAVALTSGMPADITNIVLTPGDWDVWGTLVIAPAVTTTQSDIKGWISEVSATDPGPPNNGAYCELQTTIAAGLRQALPIGTQRLLVPSGGATVRLSTQVTFAVSTLGAYGFLGARRL